MEMKRMVAQESTAQKDEEIIISIVKEMTESMTGAQSTRHWAEDALWFDIPPFASRGIQPALKVFDGVFGNFPVLQSGHRRNGRHRERRYGSPFLTFGVHTDPNV